MSVIRSSYGQCVEGVVLLAGIGTEVVEHLLVTAYDGGGKAEHQQVAVANSLERKLAGFGDKGHCALTYYLIMIQLTGEHHLSLTYNEYDVVLCIVLSMHLVFADENIGKSCLMLVDSACHLCRTPEIRYFYTLYHVA